MTTAYATAKQLSFINTLVSERQVPATISVSTTGLTTSGASELITVLLKAPRKPRPIVGADKGADALLASIPKSKYALPFKDLADFLVGTKTYGNDLLFLELKEFKGRRYLRRLHGSVGAFTRTRIAPADLLPILRAIEKGPLEAAQRFGEHYSCCGSCGAPLTDARSRELLLGPECRKHFGIAR